MNNTLSEQICQILLTGNFKKNIPDITKRQSVIDPGYMDSSSFTKGIDIMSTTRMLVNIDFYKIFTFPEYSNEEGELLKIYAPVMFYDHISAIVKKLAQGERSGKNIKLSRTTPLPSTKTENQNNDLTKADFWWDPNNDFYIFFGDEHANLILEMHKVLREINHDTVPVGNKKELASYYLSNDSEISANSYAFLNQIILEDASINDLINQVLELKSGNLSKEEEKAVIKEVNDYINQLKSFTNSNISSIKNAKLGINLKLGVSILSTIKDLDELPNFNFVKDLVSCASEDKNNYKDALKKISDSIAESTNNIKTIKNTFNENLDEEDYSNLEIMLVIAALIEKATFYQNISISSSTKRFNNALGDINYIDADGFTKSLKNQEMIDKGINILKVGKGRQ